MKYKELILSKKFWLSVLFLCSGIFANFLGKYYLVNLRNKIGKLPTLYDVSYLFIPYIKVLLIVETLVGLSVILFIIYLFKKNELKNVYHFLFMIGIFQYIRALMIVLCPMESIVQDCGFIKTLTFTGMIPSGHISLSFFFYLFTCKKSKIYPKIFIFLTILIGIGLLMARAHYSIDILVSLFIIFSIVTLYKKYVIYKDVIQIKVYK